MALNKSIFTLTIASCLGLLVISLWLAIEAGAALVHVVVPWQRQEVVAKVCNWGGLAAVPGSHAGLDVEMSDGEDSHQFRVSFTAPTADIRGWVRQSPRLATNDMRRVNAEYLRYEIYPGEQGSEGGWVEIRDSETRVVIPIAANLGPTE